MITFLFISQIIWTLAAIRQYKQNLFSFFIATAFADPIALIFKILYQNNHGVFLYINYLIMIIVLIIPGNITDIIKKDNSKKTKLFYLLSLLPIFILYLFTGTVYEYYIIIICISITVIKILLFGFEKMMNSGKLNFFYCILVFYCITLLMKFTQLIGATKKDYLIFFVVSVFELIPGIFFIIFKENDPRLDIPIAKFD